MIIKDVTPNFKEIEYKGKIYSTNSSVNTFVYKPIYVFNNKPEVSEDKYSGIRTVILDNEKDKERINDILLHLLINDSTSIDSILYFILETKYHSNLFKKLTTIISPTILKDLHTYYFGNPVTFTYKHFKHLLYSDDVSGISKYYARYLVYLWYWLPHEEFHIKVVNAMLDAPKKTNILDEILYFVLQHKNTDSIYEKYLAVTGGAYG